MNPVLVKLKIKIIKNPSTTNPIPTNVTLFTEIQ